MDSTRFRYVVAALFVAIVIAPFYVDALAGEDAGEVALSDGVAAALVGAVFLAAGYLIGRWWAIPLLLVAFILVLPLGTKPDDADEWAYAWLLLWGPLLFGLPFLLLGLVLRALVDRERRG